jgi:hypothetical protein
MPDKNGLDTRTTGPDKAVGIRTVTKRSPSSAKIRMTVYQRKANQSACTDRSLKTPYFYVSSFLPNRLISRPSPRFQETAETRSHLIFAVVIAFVMTVQMKCIHCTQLLNGIFLASRLAHVGQ